MSRVQLLAVSLAVLVTFTFATPTPPPTTTPNESDIKEASRQLVSDVRALASGAKQGMAIQTIFKKAEGLLTDASDLIVLLPGQVSECETNLVIKMAAAGTGSHEVLALLTADDALGVLNGRLSLSLAFLERVAQQLEDELALSTDVGPHLAAIVFGAKSTSSIAETADQVISSIASVPENNDNDDNKHTVVRRQSVDLGSGFSLGLQDGIKWQSNNGQVAINAKPTFSHGLGAEAGLNVHSADGNTRFNVNPSWNQQQGFGVSSGLSHDFANGNANWNVGGSWNQNQGLGLSAGLSFRF